MHRHLEAQMQRLFLATAAAAVMAGVGSARAAETVQIDGSSTVFPVTEAVAEEFQKAKGSKVRVTVGISGTGGGFKKFCRGETDISNASRPILKEEIETCKAAGVSFIELPIAYDALTVAVSPQNDFLSCVKIADLKKIWAPDAQGKITRWNQVDPSWPDAPLTLYGAGSDSGTFDYFTEAVVGKAKSSRGDYTASEDDNVLVQGVGGDRNALGYIPFAYVAENEGKLKVVEIDGGNGTCVSPSAQTVQDGTYTPLSRPLFIYVSKKAAEAKPEVREIVEFAMTKSVPLIKEVKYLQLPDRAYELSLKKFKDGKTGSVFGGVPEVGVKIEDVVSREAKS
jgi:phosphate transport system substrate-binding protein